ncbi:MAG: SRPBCC family protein [Candidatus Omnitrophica bacterium]|nr:SRPBCC family protein [Candidatus Omnitrophota bacterium]
MNRYSFVTLWRFSAPLEKVWNAIDAAEQWPLWWKGLQSVRTLRAATGPNGVGSIKRFVWRGALPYRLAFDMTVQSVEPMRRIESAAAGELEGTGRWTFSFSSAPVGGTGPVTAVRYDWNVRTQKPWMNFCAPLARPLFIWNHNVIMRWGEQGLSRHLRS